MKSPISARGWWLITAALSVIPVALIAALTMRLPASGILPPLPGAEALDYLNRPSRLSPLSPRFIEHILGADLVAGLGERSTLSPRELRELREASGRITDVHQLTNDAMTEARVIPSIPFTAKTDTRRATRTAEDPSECGSVGSTVWYRFTPDHDLALIAYTFGTDHAAALGVFTGGPGDLRLVGCQTNTAGNALVAFSAKARQTYFFQIAAPLGGGNLVFSLDPHGTTSLASRSSSGEEANSGSGLSIAVSADGRFVMFMSNATNLAEGNSTHCRLRVEGDPQFNDWDNEGPCQQVYVRDRWSGITELISRSPSGEPANNRTTNAFMSESGRYITYESPARNIDPGDSDGGWDLFFHDRSSGQTEKIPAASSGSPGEYAEEQWGGGFFHASMSEDGRYVTFNAVASDLVPGDTNLDDDVFVHDRQTGRTERVSVSSSGGQMTGRSRRGILYPSVSPDGRYVEFVSDSPTLVPNDNNGFEDVFLHDRLTHTTERLSVSTSGGDSDNQTWVTGFPRRRISSGGRYVAFASSASNLVPDDNNNGPDVFIRDRVAATTIRVSSVSSSSDQPPAPRGVPWSPNIGSISSDGRYLSFDSNAANLAAGDSEQDFDVFLYDLFTRTTILVTLSSSGGDVSGQGPALSADGRFIAYLSGPLADREVGIYGVDTDVFVYEAPRLR